MAEGTTVLLSPRLDPRATIASAEFGMGSAEFLVMATGAALFRIHSSPNTFCML